MRRVNPATGTFTVEEFNFDMRSQCIMDHLVNAVALRLIASEYGHRYAIASRIFHALQEVNVLFSEAPAVDHQRALLRF